MLKPSMKDYNVICKNSSCLHITEHPSSLQQLCQQNHIWLLNCNIPTTLCTKLILLLQRINDKWRILNLVLIQKTWSSPFQTASSLSSSLSEPYPHFLTHSQQFQTRYHLLLILHSLNVSLKSKLVTEPCREHSVCTSSGLTVILKLFKAFHQLYGI